MDTKRSAERQNEMEGTVEDLKKIEGEGLEGHEGSGADVKFVSKEEQQQRKEAEIKDVDRAFAEYVRKNLALIANRQKLYDIWLGNIQTNTYPPMYLQNSVARSVIHNNPNKPQAVYEKTGENEFLVCYVDEKGNLNRVNIDFTKIPGAKEAIKQLGHPIEFLTLQFQKMGCSSDQIGLVTSFSGHERVGLKKCLQI